MPTHEPCTPRLLGDQSWHEHAACRTSRYRDVDPDLFFPEPDEMDRIHAAKALCAQCPVRRTCLDAALENGDREGIRGGMSEEEREPLHSKLEHRLDYARVNATLAGRDVHLTKSERRAVVRAAYQADVTPERLAWLLKITEEHADKLYRRTRREIRNRSVEGAQLDDTERGADTGVWGTATSPAPRQDDLGAAA
ncbi:WhiB family transcriptional regulator [Streptomyces sp. SID5785]|uniref:WhiB family transcriptional regulator n=1 Tax=Streptomyces sp. SID5785 TaxID=2690309 RepID=UPI001361BE92|nr:WhiB family transcriptional regulator [Streptomyces sp. SID5785]MZD10406.1 WhiB family transcriptional regulator [Streptomyces sp. SID5785]